VEDLTLKQQSLVTSSRIKRLTMVFMALVLILVVAGSSIASAQSGPTALVKTGQLNLRSGPGPGFSVVGALQFGEEVTMVGRTSDSGWAQVVTSGGVTGWASTLYLLSGVPFSSLPITAQPVPWAFVTAGTANLRSGPGLQYSVVKTINGGNYVNIFARNADTTWILVKHNGDEGWLSTGVIVSPTLFGSLPVGSIVPTPVGTPGTPTSGTPTGGTGTGTGNATLMIKIKTLEGDVLIPRLNVYALNVATSKWYANVFADDCAMAVACPGEYPGIFTVGIGNVPPGDYAIFAYRTDAGGFWGGYTKNPDCGGTGTAEDHSWALVHVTAGATVTGPILCDRWTVFEGVVPAEPN
jgi:uncharacterized protein YraI